MNYYVCKKGLVKGYNIGLGSDNLYFPVPNRNVLNFKKYKGQIEVMLVDGTRMTIRDWEDRITEEEFEDKQGRGKYKIGYFLYKPLTPEQKEEQDFKKYLI